MKTHHLKSWPEQFEAILGGRPFDVRRDDRRFAVGDEIVFEEFDDRKGTLTGRQIKKTVTHTLEGVAGGIPPLRGVHSGYVVLGFAPMIADASGRVRPV